MMRGGLHRAPVTRDETMTRFQSCKHLALVLACGALLAWPLFGLDVDDSTVTHTHGGIYTDDSTHAGIYTDDSL